MVSQKKKKQTQKNPEYKHVNIHRGTGKNWNTNVNQWQISYIQIKQ